MLPKKRHTNGDLVGYAVVSRSILVPRSRVLQGVEEGDQERDLVEYAVDREGRVPGLHGRRLLTCK